MTPAAVGIHDHPTLKTGLIPNDPNKPRLALADFIVAVPDHPISSDDATGRIFGLDGNDNWGVCVPTGYDNFRRVTTGLLLGKQVDATQDLIFQWYRSQNPDFDPATGAGDNGMVIQDFLAYLVKIGEILGFAAVDTRNEGLVQAAEYLFLATIDGVDLKKAQQTQTDENAPWDYVAGSGEWGGHCVMSPKYDGDKDYCVTWQMLVEMTKGFYTHQRQEVWVAIRPEHVAHPDFRANFDLPKFAAAYTEITGGHPFPQVVTPTPTPPAPTPTDPTAAADARLAVAAHEWTSHHHVGINGTFAHEVKQWLISRNL